MAKKKRTATVDVSTECFKEVFDRINSDAGLIFVDTPEETRLIREVFARYSDQDVEFWSLGQGLHQINSKEIPEDFLPHSADYRAKVCKKGKNSDLPSNINILNVFEIIEEECYDKLKASNTPSSRTIYILRDADKFLQQPAALRALRDKIYLCSCAASTIIITGFGVQVPNDLTKDAQYVKLSYPSKQEILEKMLPLLRQKIEANNEQASDEMYINPDFNDEAIAAACTGLTEDQILNVFQYTTATDKAVSVERILEEKKAIINKSDILEYWICEDKIGNVGGFAKLKEWFSVRKAILEHPENAEAFGAPYPKGILLLGMQGSGKTYTGKAIAQDWEVGLIKFDTGKVFAGLVGESEKRMRQALTQVQAAAPCVVLLDELDKALSGAGSSDKTDGGTTSRVIGTMLTWLQEDHPGVFLICTANDISNLLNNHPELLRKGRFDEIWFSDIPTVEERKEIFSIHLKKLGRDPSKFDLDELAAVDFTDEDSDTVYDYTGAEIEYAVKDAVQEKFARGGGKVLKIGGASDIKTSDIVEKLQIIKPMAKVAADKIRKMRRWAGNNARNVSGIRPEEKAEKDQKPGRINMRQSVSVSDCQL